MRFVIAIVLFLLAFVSIGYGIAQRTILAGPASFTASVTTDASTPITLIDGATLHSFEGTQAITVSGAKKVFVADGRTSDVLAWVGKTSYTKVTFDAVKQKLTTKRVRGEADTAPSPVGSDLWDQEFSGTDQLIRRVNVPTDATVIIMSDGKKAAPDHIAVTWPLDNSAPWSGPLIIGGIGALLLGLGAFLWALVHARRRRGPRRRQPRLPRNPKPPQLKRGRTGTQPALTAGAARGRRRNLVAVSLVLGSTLALSGCSVFGSSGGSSSSATPTSTSTVPGGAGLQQIAVTAPQLKQIVANVVQTVTAADAKSDAKLAATRLDGPALQLRVANYAIRAADSTQPALPAIPQGELKVSLPQQSDTWPRAVLAVIQPTDPKTAPVALMLVQKAPRDNYKVEYLMTLELGVPKVAPATVGAARLLNDNKLGILAPSDLAAAYGDILIKGDASTYNDQFSATGDKLRTAVGYAHKQDQKSKLPSTATVAYSNGPGPGESIAFGTNDSGQIVAVNLDDTETVTPTEAGAAINPQGQVKLLSGKAQSVKGITATYGMQLLFYVPPVSKSGAKIQLLGFGQGLISASEVP
ncbi:hypothetical protein ACFPJ4_15280 [Lysinimonas soli]|uniref:DUF8094 domain-containing protein n=1 Tax=Lysinimonas soli TaxID=1074233 RepID=A0ABW0NU74_9MICO